MSIYHLSVKTISRNTGRSAVAAAAYRAGENIKNERDGIFHKYAGRKDVEYSKILLPKGAPERWQKRAILWNDVEHKEKRKDARTAREIEVGLPIEFDQEKKIEVLTKFCEQEFVSQGMIADINIHDKGDGNPHAHIMLTTRSIKGGEFGKKNRGWDCRENVSQWRKVWADVCNECLEEDQQIDHRSYEEQGRNQLPMIHEGSAATAMKRRGEYSERADHNRQVRELNKKQVEMEAMEKVLQRQKQMCEGWSKGFLSVVEPQIFEDYMAKGSFKTGSHRIRIFESREDLLSCRTIMKILVDSEKYAKMCEDSWVSFESVDAEAISDYLKDHDSVDTLIFSIRKTQKNDEKIAAIKKFMKKEKPGREIGFYRHQPLGKVSWKESLEEYALGQKEYMERMMVSEQSFRLRGLDRSR